MNYRFSAILAITVLLVTFAGMASAADTTTWWITGAAFAKTNGGSIAFTDHRGHEPVAQGNRSDLEYFLVFADAAKPEELTGQHYDCSDLEQFLAAAVKWGKNISDLAVGITTKANFKSDAILGQSQYFYHCPDGWHLQPAVFKALNKQVSVQSKGKYELIQADARYLHVMPKTECFATLALKGKAVRYISVAGAAKVAVGHEVHLFTIASDCTNAVQFDFDPADSSAKHSEGFTIRK